jgi:transcriptional regulator with XRE-family HTH domain
MTGTDLLLLVEARDAARSGRGRTVRLAAGLAQRDIAEAIGVSPVAVSRWEAGDRRPRGEPALRYARLLRELTGAIAA